jgi:dipeptidyl aminopeptidase/acylaminoacyl peptidase
MYRHWNIWEDGSYSHIFIADYPDMINTIDIMEGEPYDVPIYPGGSIDEIQFSNDGKKIVYACKKLKGKEYAVSTNSDIYLFDIDKKTTTNLSESNKGYDLNPVFSPDGKYLIWGSMKTPGYESDKLRMILYDLQTNTANDYSSLFEESATNFVFSADSKYIYFISGTKATYQLFVFDIKKKTIKQLTQGRHDYKSIAITSTNRLIGIRESMIEPADIYSIDIKKGIQTRLTSINEEVLKGIASIQVEERWITTTDNKKMLVWVILPPNFQPTKKYPAVLYCQGGPQQAVSQFFSYRWNFQMMASQGYVIVAPNRRGLPTFGEEWNAQISGDYGGQNMKDYLSAIDEIAKEPYIDKSKLGCVGASYGGFSVYWLAGNHEKRFKAFISHCGMFNLESWYGSTEEMFFANYDLTGPYWEPETKKVYNVSPHKFVKNWDTPILIIHGGNDFRIPYTQAMEAFNAAQLQGIPSKFLFFPDETHFVTKPQNAILWQREFMGWLAKWLK